MANTATSDKSFCKLPRKKKKKIKNVTGHTDWTKNIGPVDGPNNVNAHTA